MALSTSDGQFRSALYGCTGGLTAAVIGHPIDTIKTRMQTGLSFTQAFRSGSLWRGLMAPVTAVPPAWVANFVAYSLALELTGDETSLQHAAAGAMSGVVWGGSVAPFELVKCIAQKENISTNQVWKSWMDRSTRNFQMTRGLGLTVARDCIGLAVWFSVFHKLRTEYHWSSFASGGACATANWLLIFPIDTLLVQHRVNTLSLSESFRSLKMEAIKNPNYFLRPEPIILTRACIATATSMAVVGWCRDML